MSLKIGSRLTGCGTKASGGIRTTSAAVPLSSRRNVTSPRQSSFDVTRIEGKFTGTSVFGSQSFPFLSSMIEFKNGKLWVATRGSTFVYDGKTFAAFAHDDNPFTNVRTLIEDKKGNIWLSGNDGLWRFDGKSFTNFTRTFAGYVYEDSEGNIWTSSGGIAGQKDWALSKYDGKSLSDKNATPPEIIQANEGMIFGIMEAKDGSIWFGTLGGVKRYDGEKVEEFREK